jgi:hypothetical protein
MCRVNPLATLGVGMDRITISVPPQADFHPAIRLVIGGIGARSRLSYEQVSELQLAVENLVAQNIAAADAIHVEADVEDGLISLFLGPFEPRGDPSLMRVVERLVDRAAILERNGVEWVELVCEVSRA